MVVGGVNLETLRTYCLAFSGATENVQWGDDLVFKVGGKMFTVACLVPDAPTVSFKCTPEEFAERSSWRTSGRRNMSRGITGSRCSRGARCPIATSAA